MTKKELSALKAVTYGCSENFRTKDKKFVVYKNEGDKVVVEDTIEFAEAIEVVRNLISKESKKKNGK